MIGQGQVMVRPVGANLKSRRWFGGRMDPYCVVSSGRSLQSTPVAFRAGSAPAWNTELHVVAGAGDVLNVQVRDAHPSRHGKLIGEAAVPLQSVFQSGYQRMVYPLTRRGRHRGEITLEIRAPTYGYGTGGYAPSFYTAPTYAPQYSVVTPVAPAYAPRVSVSRYYTTAAPVSYVAPTQVTYTSATPLGGLQQSYLPGGIAPAASQIYTYRSRPSFC